MADSLQLKRGDESAIANRKLTPKKKVKTFIKSFLGMKSSKTKKSPSQDNIQFEDIERKVDQGKRSLW